MKVKVLETYISEDEELHKGIRRLNLLSDTPELDDLFYEYYDKYLEIARKIVDTDNFVVPLILDDKVFLLELDYVYDNLNYRVLINSADYQEELVELII